MWVFDGREVEFVVEEHEKQVVRDVELVVLNFVVWAPVFALAELVVSSAILVAVFPDCRWYGGCVTQMIRIPICRVRLIMIALL